MLIEIGNITTRKKENYDAVNNENAGLIEFKISSQQTGQVNTNAISETVPDYTGTDTEHLMVW